MNSETTTNPSQSITLSTPEILHLILAFLPPRYLLTSAQRVCHTWHDTINNSPTIQQQLFFKPLPAFTIPMPRSYYQTNPLLREAFPSLFSSERVSSKSLNAATSRVLGDFQGDLYRDALMAKGASWRRMLVRQPPAFRLCMLEPRVRDGRTEVMKKTLCFEDEGGLRMGFLYDVVLQWVGIPGRYCQAIWVKVPHLQLREDGEKIGSVVADAGE